MRIQINLATRPYVELGPFFLRLRLLMGGLAVLAAVLMFAAHLLSLKAEKQQAELDQLRNRTIAAQQTRLHVEQRMRNPANAAALDRAHFLNSVFLRKSFSWTAVMMDLENVLPSGVQVTSIEPQVAPTGSVAIRLRVAGERDRAVQLVRNLERSRRFLAPRLAGESAQSRESVGRNATQGLSGVPQAAGLGANLNQPSGVEFEIVADYNPLPIGQPYVEGHRAAAVSSAAEGSSMVRTGRHPVQGIGAGAENNVRRGFPADGVRLPAYQGAPGATAVPQQGAR